jgi:hypothetical protein
MVGAMPASRSRAGMSFRQFDARAGAGISEALSHFCIDVDF